MPPALTRLKAIALPLLRDNIDTDELIPVSENTRVSMSGWGDGLFASKRYLDGVGRTLDPSFILNQAPFDQAGILIAGDNFGCGSSRESAVWALRDYGFRAVVATTFNETFQRNCIVNGVAPLAMSREDIESLAADVMRDPWREVCLDLNSGMLFRDGTADPGQAFAFRLDPFYCTLLTTGQTEDDLLETLRDAIDRRRDSLVSAAPWLRSGVLRKAEPE
ncbi:MAG: 3-isopropylmalate dehydratase small subunit [Beijerinckiaceae bacterium]|nr:3-isopropylmalate dehydratase small subunit [Beijerinckiaceae bacterium]